jgi:hypothetical protein
LNIKVVYRIPNLQVIESGSTTKSFGGGGPGNLLQRILSACKHNAFAYISKEMVLRLHTAGGRTFSVKIFASEKYPESCRCNLKYIWLILLPFKLENKWNPEVLTERRYLVCGQLFQFEYTYFSAVAGKTFAAHCSVHCVQ